MRILFFVISLFILFKTLGYGWYEWKEKDNVVAAIVILLLALFSVICINVFVSFIY